MADAKITGNIFAVIVKPNSSKTGILGFDRDKNAHMISVAAPASGNKANRELLKFLSRITGRRARIKSGLGSRKKIIELV